VILHRLLLAASAALALLTAPAYASLIDNPSGLGPGYLTQTFADVATYDTSVPRVQIGTSLGINLGVTGYNGTLNFGAPAGAWTLRSNGEWTGERFVAIDGEGDPNQGIFPSMRFDFGTQTVRAFGAFMNFDPDFVYGGGGLTFPLPLYIAAYDANGVELGSHFLSISTPGGINAGAFYGIAFNDAVISHFEISGPYAVATNLSFSAPVPEPSTYAMMAAGMLLLGAVVRRQRRRG